jgi:hypothetical protein
MGHVNFCHIADGVNLLKKAINIMMKYQSFLLVASKAVSVEINVNKPKYKNLDPGMLRCVDW